jgi:hypothetical protein
MSGGTAEAIWAVGSHLFDTIADVVEILEIVTVNQRAIDRAAKRMGDPNEPD